MEGGTISKNGGRDQRKRFRQSTSETMSNPVTKRKGKSGNAPETIVEPEKKHTPKKKRVIGNLHLLLALLGLIAFVWLSFPDLGKDVHASDWARMPREQVSEEAPSGENEQEYRPSSGIANVQEHTEPNPEAKKQRKDAAEIPDIPPPDLSSPPTRGGWKVEDNDIMQKFGSDICNIDIKYANELTTSEFEEVYLLKKPVLLKFRNGAVEWTAPEKWQKDNFVKEFSGWSMRSGNSLDITRTGGIGNIKTSFGQFLEHMMNETDSIGDTYYIFDGYFFLETSAFKALRPPLYLQIKFGSDAGIFMLGGPGSGVAFHSHGDGWNAVVYGKKRWFIYPREKTPPGGVPAGYSQKDWIRKIYPTLSDDEKPLECIQEAGDILYLPEGFYHATINLADTLGISIHDTVPTEESQVLFSKDTGLDKRLQESKPQERYGITKQRKENIDQLLLLHPWNTEALLRAGRIYHDSGMYNESIRFLRDAIDRDPQFLMAQLHLAIIYNQHGESELAEELFKRILNLNHYFWETYFTYGAFLQQHQRLEEAVEMAKRGVEIQPLSTQLLEMLMNTQKLLERGEDADLTYEKLKWLQFAGEEAGLHLAIQKSKE
ncbi:hypothetical protein ScPMuIL_007472 [Solemya velum]